MKRTIMLLTVVALMVAMMVATAAPAFAQVKVGDQTNLDILGVKADLGVGVGLDTSGLQKNLNGLLGGVTGLLGGGA